MRPRNACRRSGSTGRAVVAIVVMRSPFRTSAGRFPSGFKQGAPAAVEVASKQCQRTTPRVYPDGRAPLAVVRADGRGTGRNGGCPADQRAGARPDRVARPAPRITVPRTGRRRAVAGHARRERTGQPAHGGLGGQVRTGRGLRTGGQSHVPDPERGRARPGRPAERRARTRRTAARVRRRLGDRRPLRLGRPACPGLVRRSSSGAGRRRRRQRGHLGPPADRTAPAG